MMTELFGCGIWWTQRAGRESFGRDCFAGCYCNPEVTQIGVVAVV